MKRAALDAPSGRPNANRVRRTRRALAALVVTGTAVSGVPLLTAVPAYATGTVICVGSPVGTCDQTVASIPAAITAAAGVDATILVGPGTYSDGPYNVDGSVHALTLRGSGQGSTVLTLPGSASSQDYVLAHHATVRDLTIQMVADQSSNDRGLKADSGSTIDHVTVDGTVGVGTYNATGMAATASTVLASDIEMPLGSSSASRAIYSGGGATISDTSLVGDAGFVHSEPTIPDGLSRVTIAASTIGIWTDSGSVSVDDAVIDLGTGSGTGLLAFNSNAETALKEIDANHVTVVGGGTNSRGAYAGATYPGVVQHSTITLANSIVRGPATDLVVGASNGGSLGGSSTATINTTYSDWHSKTETSGANGVAQVVSGSGHLDVDPAFADPVAGNYRLTPASPVVDRGDPAAGGPTTDLGGSARITDGNGDGVAVRDIGAYERPAKVAHDTTAPDTRFTAKPAKRVQKRRVAFKFVSTESGSTFTCKLDRHPWRACTSPMRFKVTIGRHRFAVRARDAAGNTDPTPATYRFRRVR